MKPPDFEPGFQSKAGSLCDAAAAYLDLAAHVLNKFP